MEEKRQRYKRKGQREIKKSALVVSCTRASNARNKNIIENIKIPINDFNH